MAYTYNPTPSESSILAQVRQRESGGNYTALVSPATCAASGATKCTAAGAYQFVDATWQMAAQATGVGTEYGSAADAPAWMQDTNALWLLRYVGGNPNASMAWGASAPAALPAASVTGTSGDPLVDLSGAAAATPTADILAQLGIDPTAMDVTGGFDPTTLVIAGGVALLAYLVVSR